MIRLRARLKVIVLKISALQQEKTGEFTGLCFRTQMAKWLEAVVYTWAEKPISELKKLADSVIELISRLVEPMVF